MARRTLLRSLLTATLMVVPSAVGVLAASSPAGAIDNPDHRVTVYETSFNPNIVYALRGETVQFDLAPGVSTNHTVTLENGVCADRPMRLCEETFDDPENPPVFRFSDYGEYPYYDRHAREAGNHDMRGRIIITDNPPTVPPPQPPPTTTSSTTSTTMSSTTTTRPATTTTLPPTTATTAPTTVRPFVIGDPGPTTTTTTPAPAGAATTGSPKKGGTAAPPSGDKGKDKGKGNGKGKAASVDTPATAQPASPEGSPIEVTFDPATLTPLPEPSATANGDTTPDSGPEESAMLDLLSADNAIDDGTDLLVMALAVLGALVLLTGAVAWFRRSSRYFPA